MKQWKVYYGLFNTLFVLFFWCVGKRLLLGIDDNSMVSILNTHTQGKWRYILLLLQSCLPCWAVLWLEFAHIKLCIALMSNRMGCRFPTVACFWQTIFAWLGESDVQWVVCQNRLKGEETCWGIAVRLVVCHCFLLVVVVVVLVVFDVYVVVPVVCISCCWSWRKPKLWVRF